MAFSCCGCLAIIVIIICILISTASLKQSFEFSIDSVSAECNIGWRYSMYCDDWFCYDRRERCILFATATNNSICGTTQETKQYFIPVSQTEAMNYNCSEIETRFMKMHSTPFQCWIDCSSKIYSLTSPFHDLLFSLIAFIGLSCLFIIVSLHCIQSNINLTLLMMAFICCLSFAFDTYFTKAVDESLTNEYERLGEPQSFEYKKWLTQNY